MKIVGNILGGCLFESVLTIWCSSLLEDAREGGACLSCTVRKKSQNWLAFSTDENSETLESSALNDGRSMLAMLLTDLHKVEGLETETLK